MDERNQQNFDHPEAIDIELFNKQMESLLGGKPVKIPIYDFSSHNRIEQLQLVKPTKIIIVEGILTLYFESLRKFCLLYTSPSPRDATLSRMPSSA